MDFSSDWDLLPIAVLEMISDVYKSFQIASPFRQKPWQAGASRQLWIAALPPVTESLRLAPCLFVSGSSSVGRGGGLVIMVPATAPGTGPSHSTAERLRAAAGPGKDAVPGVV